MGKLNYRTDDINKKLKQIDELVGSNNNLLNQINNFNSRLDTIENKELNNDTLHMFSPFKNNKQGDCFILNYNDKTILIDTGDASSADTVINYIKSKNINKIDYTFITHYHPDHCTALSKLVENLDFSTCKFLLPPSVDWSRFLGDTTTLKNNEQSVLNVITTNAFNYIYLTHEYVLTIDNIKLRFLNCNTVNYEYYYSTTGDSNGPIKNDTTNYNNFSVGLIVEHEKNKLYFPSDIDIKGQEVTLSEIENVDFMCYPHHACNELSYGSFLNVLSPRIALASGVGFNRNTSSDYRKLLSSTIAYQNNEDFELLSSGNSIKVLKGRTVYTPGFPSDYGTPISNGSDLNSFIDEGKYISSNGGVSATLLNTPVTVSGFKLEVEHIVQNSALIQTLTANNSAILKYERYYNFSTKTFGRWIDYSKRNNTNISDRDTTILNDFIDSMYEGQYQFLNIPKTSTMFSELSGKINDEHGLFLRIEKMNNTYSILTLIGKSVEKMFIGHYVSGNLTWKEVTLV